MPRQSFDWLNLSLLSMPGFFFEGEGGGATDPPADPPATDPPTDKEEKFDAVYVKQLRSENAARRKEAADLAAKLKAIEEKDLSESDKLRKEHKEATEKATAAEARARDIIGEARVVTVATKANAIDSEAVYALLRSQLEFDADGKPTNVERLVADLKKARPHLFTPARGGSADGGAGGSGGSVNGGMNAFIRGGR